MTRRPTVIVFDVNETLSDMAPIASRFIDVGAPGHLATTWFASLLRDGFALTAAGSSMPFAEIGDGALRVALAGLHLDRDLDADVAHVMDGFRTLAVHPDVADGVRSLRAAGLRLVTLSNGPASIADDLLSRAGLREDFERCLSVEDAGSWKPAAGAYRYAAQACGCDVGEMMLVAVHPWDVDGAARAGMSTALVNRTGGPYPAYFTPPQITVPRLSDLSRELGD
ncbi:MAG: haloacid dehalogenase type II [Nocardioidaceae bacterium]